MEQLSFELLFIFFFPCVSFSLYVFRQRVTFHLIAETTHQTINSQNILQCMIFLGYLQLHEMDLGTSAFTAYMSTSFDTIINHVNVTNLFYFSIGFKIKSWKPLSTYLLYVRFFSFFSLFISAWLTRGTNFIKKAMQTQHFNTIKWL